jgi:hypothetical protein
MLNFNMKNLIRKILQEQEEIITLPPFHYFDNDWNLVLELSEGKPFKILGDVDLIDKQEITTLGNCYAVGGFLDLYNCTNLQSLGNLTEVGSALSLHNCTNLQSLGNLTKVGGDLDLYFCENLESLGNLTKVGGYLGLSYTPIADTMTEDEIRQQVNVGGKIYL